MTRDPRIQLSQRTDTETVLFNTSDISLPIESDGLRGLAVWVAPNSWESADMLFAIHYGAASGLIRNQIGVLVRLGGITPGCWHVSPPELWVLGAATHFQIVSVAVGNSTPVVQNTVVQIARLR